MKLVQWVSVVVTLILLLCAFAYILPKLDLFALQDTSQETFVPPPVLSRSGESDDGDASGSAESGYANKDETEPEEETKEDDYFRENPFEKELASDPEAKRPKAKMPELVHAFGKMSLGSTGHYDFLIQNEGEAPLKIAKGPTQCKCTLTGLKLQEVPPGGEAEVHLEWTPKSYGPFSQGAVIYTNDPDNDKIEFIVQGNMVPEIAISPESGWSLGSLAPNVDIPLSGTIRTEIFDDFEITSMETSSDLLDFQLRKMEERELEAMGASVAYDFQGTLKTTDETRKINEELVFLTNNEKYPRIVLPITGFQGGALLIVGKNWYSRDQLVDLGKVSSGTERELKLTFVVEPRDEPMQLTDVATTPDFLQVRLEPEKVGKDLAKERYSFYITVPKDAQRGLWNKENYGKIVGKTNNPKINSFEMKVLLEIE